MGEELTTQEQEMLPLDSYEFAVKAGQFVVNEFKEMVHYGRVEGLAKHAFCVAGYIPQITSLDCLEDMAFMGASRAWVIDPWMNIACKFREYPKKVKIKLGKWNTEGKHIRREGALYYPLGTFFHQLLTKGRVRFQQFDELDTGEQCVVPNDRAAQG